LKKICVNHANPRPPWNYGLDFKHMYMMFAVFSIDVQYVYVFCMQLPIAIVSDTFVVTCSFMYTLFISVATPHRRYTNGWTPSICFFKDANCRYYGWTNERTGIINHIYTQQSEDKTFYLINIGVIDKFILLQKWINIISKLYYKIRYPVELMIATKCTLLATMWTHDNFNFNRLL
jgi:hypothetical protein